MDNSAELIEALVQISKEKGIDKEVIFEAIEASLVSACKKNFGTSQNIKVVMNRETGSVQVFAQKTVVEAVSDENLEISLDSARKLSISYEPGDIVDIVVTPRNFGRISAQTAKQVVVQKFREAERDILFNEYASKEHEIVTGIVSRKEHKNVIIGLGKIDALLAASEQIPREIYNFHDRIKVYVQEVRQTAKGPAIKVSRSCPELVKRLFEQEVPEVFDGIVEIKSIAREAGNRTKIAVYSKNQDVDPVGACVGQNGYRVNIIVQELKGEKIDIITWNEDPKLYIAAALSPSKVMAVSLSPDEQSAKIVVPDHQLSLAIGKEGQNARLAAKLTGWRIDIKSESQAQAMDFVDRTEYFDYYPYEDGYDDEYEEEYDEYDENGEYYDEESGEYDGEYEDGDGEYEDGEYDEGEYTDGEYAEDEYEDDGGDGYDGDGVSDDTDDAEA